MPFYGMKFNLTPVAVACILVFAACSADEPVDKYAEIEACIAEANYDCAKKRLKEIDEPKAKVLLAMSEFALWTEMMGGALVEVAEYVDTVAGDNAPAFEPAAGASQRIVNETLYQILIPGWQQLEKTLTAFDAAAAVTEAYDLKVMPLFAGNVPLTALQGEFGPTDRLMIESWLNLLAWAYTSVMGTDFGFDIGPLVRYAISLPECKIGVSNEEARKCAANLTAFVIGNEPNVFQIEPSRGKELIAQSREHLAKFFEKSDAFLQKISTNPPSDSWAQWVADPKGGGWISVEVGKTEITLERVQELFESGTRKSIPDWVTETVRYRVPASVLEKTVDVAGNVRTGQPEYVSVNEAILPAATTGIEVLLQIEGLVRITQILLSGIDPTVATALAELAENLQGLYSNYEDRDGLSNLFAFVLPDSLGFSFYKIYENPNHIRSWMPDLVTNGTFNDSARGEIPTYEWLVEWECAAEHIENFICKFGESIKDTDHFSRGGITIPADGVASFLPYVGYSDPTFNKAIVVDPNDVDREFPRGVTSPDLQQFNTMLQEILVELGVRLGFQF
jgi:hypothetical protein